MAQAHVTPTAVSSQGRRAASHAWILDLESTAITCDPSMYMPRTRFDAYQASGEDIDSGVLNPYQRFGGTQAATSGIAVAAMISGTRVPACRSQISRAA